MEDVLPVIISQVIRENPRSIHYLPVVSKQFQAATATIATREVNWTIEWVRDTCFNIEYPAQATATVSGVTIMDFSADLQDGGGAMLYVCARRHSYAPAAFMIRKRHNFQSSIPRGVMDELVRLLRNMVGSKDFARMDGFITFVCR